MGSCFKRTKKELIYLDGLKYELVIVQHWDLQIFAVILWQQNSFLTFFWKSSQQWLHTRSCTCCCRLWRPRQSSVYNVQRGRNEKLTVASDWFSQCVKQVQRQQWKYNRAGLFRGKKAAVHQSKDGGRARLFAPTPALWSPAKDMRRLQAVNKVEPIGWRSAFVLPSMLCERWPGIVGIWSWS